VTDGGDEMDDEDQVEQWLEDLRIPYPGPGETQNNVQKAAAGRALFYGELISLNTFEEQC
jgi:hypothetical protein